jgi:tetratricopeptide (TPR) repeat protein
VKQVVGQASRPVGGGRLLIGRRLTQSIQQKLWGGPPGPRGSPWTRFLPYRERADEGVGRGPGGPPYVGNCLAVLLFLLFSLPAFSQTWESLNQQIEQAYLKGDFKESIRLAKLALQAASDPKQTGRSLDRLGFLYYESGNLKDGEPLLRQSLELRKTKVGPDTADYAETANDLAIVCRDTARFPEAFALAEEAVAIRSRVLGKTDPLLAESLNTLGTVHSYQGQYEQAATRFEEALAIHESHLDPAHPDPEYGTLCINMGGNYQRMGKYSRAEALFQKGLAVLAKVPGKESPSYAISLIGLAYLQTDMGNYSAAEKVYDEADGLLKVQIGEQHPMYATFLNNRGFLYNAIGHPDAAEADYRKSLEIKQKIFTPENIAIGASLRNLARVVLTRNPAEGEKLFQEAVDLYAKLPSPAPFDYASVLLGLGEAQRKRGDLTGALQTLKKAMDVTAQGLGTKHPLYAGALSESGLVYQAIGDYPNAERRFNEAIAIVTETYGENHPDLARHLQLLAMLYEQTGNYRAALPLYRRSFEINDKFLTDILNVGSESSKVAVLSNLEDLVPVLISFQQRAGNQIPEARALAFEAVARRKGRVLDQVRDWRQRLRQNPDSTIRKRLDTWESLLECQASLTIALGYRDLKPAVVGTCALQDTGLEGQYERLLHELRAKWTPDLGQQALKALQVLKQRTETLEAVLSRELPQFELASNAVRLEDLQSHLAADELFLDFVEYQPRDSHGKIGADRRYGAFLLDRGGDLRWVELGPAAPIDSAIRDLIQAANDWSTSLGSHEKQAVESAQTTANDAIGTLSKKILTPLNPWFAQQKQARSLRIAPDGMLTLLPFGALSNGRFLDERFAISYLPAGRDLVLPEHSTPVVGPPVIALSPGAGGRRPTAGNVVASVFRADRLERLAGAEIEARGLQVRLPHAILLAEGEATEQTLKKLHSPALLHILGHGIVRGNEDCKIRPESPGCELVNLDPAARAMSLSAIVLEEAYGRGRGSPEDGLLTALELQALDLNGSEMLVLSQCRMADGVPSVGEGVYGMRRAAAIAGVKTFVAPLWRVADSAQEALMTRFYKELSAGRSRVEALRLAKLQLLRKPETANFLYWAPVILSGDPGPLPAALFQR